jgi:hypothetical protein
MKHRPHRNAHTGQPRKPLESHPREITIPDHKCHHSPISRSIINPRICVRTTVCPKSKTKQREQALDRSDARNAKKVNICGRRAVTSRGGTRRAFGSGVNDDRREVWDDRAGSNNSDCLWAGMIVPLTFGRLRVIHEITIQICMSMIRTHVFSPSAIPCPLSLN